MRLEPLFRISMRYADAAWIGPFGSAERAGFGWAILARLELLSEVGGTYSWLNTSFIVGEGEIDEETDEWWIRAYVAINEVVAHPPAIGDTPPERFRQTGS